MSRLPASVRRSPCCRSKPAPIRPAYFAGGLHDELLTQLSKVAALKVISRTSVMGYQEADEALAGHRRRAECAASLKEAFRWSAAGSESMCSSLTLRRTSMSGPTVRSHTGRSVCHPERPGAADRGGRGSGPRNRRAGAARGNASSERGGMPGSICRDVVATDRDSGQNYEIEQQLSPAGADTGSQVRTRSCGAL